jgi:hypothetical protein
MKLFALLFFFASLSAYAQTCYVDMMSAHRSVIRTYVGQGNCERELHECMRTIRHQPQLGGVNCTRQSGGRPFPGPRPGPNPYPYPQPNPYPQPQPTPYPYPGERFPEEVLRMNEIEQASNFVLQDCHVLSRVSGWSNQLYVRGQFVGNFEVGRQDFELRRAIREYQYRGQCMMRDARTLSVQFRPSLIQEALDQTLSRNCYIQSGNFIWYQLYINKQFSGNFDQQSNSDLMKLKSELASKIISGACHERSYEERQILQSPYLIEDFSRFQYRNCHLRMHVSGWSHQLYVNGVFSGNFDQNTEIQKLKSTLVELIMNRTCIRDRL